MAMNATQQSLMMGGLVMTFARQQVAFEYTSSWVFNVRPAHYIYYNIYFIDVSMRGTKTKVNGNWRADDWRKMGKCCVFFFYSSYNFFCSANLVRPVDMHWMKHQYVVLSWPLNPDHNGGRQEVIYVIVNYEYDNGIYLILLYRKLMASSSNGDQFLRRLIASTSSQPETAEIYCLIQVSISATTKSCHTMNSCQAPVPCACTRNTGRIIHYLSRLIPNSRIRL